MQCNVMHYHDGNYGQEQNRLWHSDKALAILRGLIWGLKSILGDVTSAA